MNKNKILQNQSFDKNQEASISLNDISLNNILDSMIQQRENNDIDDIFEEFQKKYRDKLEFFEIVNPKTLIHDIKKGDTIRYAKHIDDKLSCASIVMNIRYSAHVDEQKYVDKQKSYIKKILLRSINHTDSFWEIDPISYFIFKRIPREKESGFDKFIKSIAESKIDSNKNKNKNKKKIKMKGGDEDIDKEKIYREYKFVYNVDDDKLDEYIEKNKSVAKNKEKIMTLADAERCIDRYIEEYDKKKKKKKNI